MPRRYSRARASSKGQRFWPSAPRDLCGCEDGRYCKCSRKVRRARQRAAEHQYLLDKKAMMGVGSMSYMMGIDPATWNALQRVPSTGTTIPQLSQWARDISDLAQQAGSVFSRIDQFVGIIGGRMAIMAAGADRFLSAIQKSESVSRLKAMMSALPKIEDFNRFFDAIAPALEGFRELMEDARDGDAVLEEVEFGFADHLWNVFYLRGFAHIHPQVRSAVVTRKLAAHTSSDHFADELHEEVEASRMMRRRWRVIEAALEAHAARKYELSVPVLLSQIEGAVGDIMLIKDLVVKEGNKYYLVDEFGNYKLNKKGKRLGPVTLDPALKAAKLEDHVGLAAASEFMADVMVQRRNDVLHGRDVSYGRAKFSVQALLILTILAQGVAELESNGP
jgi:hypothetical protein